MSTSLKSNLTISIIKVQIRLFTHSPRVLALRKPFLVPSINPEPALLQSLPIEDTTISQMNSSILMYGENDCIYEELVKEDESVTHVVKQYKSLVETELNGAVFVVFAFNMIDKLLNYSIHELIIVEKISGMRPSLLGSYINKALKLISVSIPSGFEQLKGANEIENLKRIAKGFSEKLSTAKKLLGPEALAVKRLCSKLEVHIDDVIDDLVIVEKRMNAFIAQLDLITSPGKTMRKLEKKQHLENRTKSLFDKSVVLNK